MKTLVDDNPHKDTNRSYQDCMDIVHPSQDTYPSLVNEFFDHMSSLGINKLIFGWAYCPVRGAHRIRHLSVVMDNAELIYPENLDWPFMENDFKISMNHDIDANITTIFKDTNFCDMSGYLWVCNVPRRLFKEESSLFITEPELRDDLGNEIEWNMNTEF